MYILSGPSASPRNLLEHLEGCAAGGGSCSDRLGGLGVGGKDGTWGYVAPSWSHQHGVHEPTLSSSVTLVPSSLREAAYGTLPPSKGYVELKSSFNLSKSFACSKQMLCWSDLQDSLLELLSHCSTSVSHSLPNFMVGSSGIAPSGADVSP